MRRNNTITKIVIIIVTILVSIIIIGTALFKEEKSIFQLSGKNKNFEAADVQYKTILLDTQGGGTESVRYVYIKANQISDTKLYVCDNNGNYVGYNTGEKIPNVIPAKTNSASGESYLFKGYYTAQNGGGEQIIDEEGRITGNGIYDWLHSSSTAMVYTYASWESVSYKTILLDTQGGGTESVRYLYIKPNQVSDTKLYVRDSGGNYIGYNTGDKISNIIPTKTNETSGQIYKFKGYYTAQNGGGEQIIDEEGRITGNGIYDWLHSSSTAMVYTYASWESVSYKTILLDTQGGGTESVRYLYIKPNQVSDTKLYVHSSYGYYVGYNIGERIANVIPTKTNEASGQSYKFKGYYTAQNGGGEQIIDEEGRITGNGIYDWLHSSSTAMVYTYALWEKVSGSESETKPGTGTEDGTGSGSETKPGTGTEDGTGSGSETKPGTGTGDGTGSGGETKPGTGTGDETGSGSETKPGTGTGDGTGSGSETKPGTGTGDGTGSGSETKPGTGTGDGTGSGSETKPGTGTEDGTGSGSETKPETETGIQTSPRIELETTTRTSTVAKESILGSKDATLANTVIPKTGNSTILIIGIIVSTGFAIIFYKKSKI